MLILRLWSIVMKNSFLILGFLFIVACGKTDTELAMERGIQYYEWNLIEKAINEFSYVIYQLKDDGHSPDYDELDLLARAHHNLAVSYAKKKWYDVAESEAQKSFNLNPSDANMKILKAIQGKKKEQDDNSQTKTTNPTDADKK